MSTWRLQAKDFLEGARRMKPGPTRNELREVAKVLRAIAKLDEHLRIAPNGVRRQAADRLSSPSGNDVPITGTSRQSSKEAVPWSSLVVRPTQTATLPPPRHTSRRSDDASARSMRKPRPGAAAGRSRSSPAGQT